MAEDERSIISSNQEKGLETSAIDFYNDILTLADQAIEENFTLEGFYNGRQIFTTPEGSQIMKEAHVMHVDKGVEDLFLERGFTKKELKQDLIFINEAWLSQVGEDRKTFANSPVVIRTTYIHVGKNKIKVIERESEGESEGDWKEVAIREEDLAFLKMMYTATAIPFSIVEKFKSHESLDQIILKATGGHIYREGIDYTTHSGRVLFNGGLSHFTRILEKTKQGIALSSSSEIQTSSVLLNKQQGHFETLFQITSGQPIQLKRIDDPFKLLGLSKDEDE